MQFEAKENQWVLYTHPVSAEGKQFLYPTVLTDLVWGERTEIGALGRTEPLPATLIVVTQEPMAAGRPDADAAAARLMPVLDYLFGAPVNAVHYSGHPKDLARAFTAGVLALAPVVADQTLKEVTDTFAAGLAIGVRIEASQAANGIEDGAVHVSFRPEAGPSARQKAMLN